MVFKLTLIGVPILQHAGSLSSLPIPLMPRTCIRSYRRVVVQIFHVAAFGFVVVGQSRGNLDTARVDSNMPHGIHGVLLLDILIQRRRRRRHGGGVRRIASMSMSMSSSAYSNIYSNARVALVEYRCSRLDLVPVAISLQSLRLEFNFFSGTIPSELGNLVNLVDLRLDTNSLSGPLPQEIGSLTALGRYII
jgi:hypothetical protein